MPQWGSVDNAANSVLWAPAQLNKAPTRAEANTLFGNTTADAYVVGQTNATVAVDDVETRTDGGRFGHAGWQLRTVGSGGRAGRTIYETLVASSSMSGDTVGDDVANYIIIITDQPDSDEVAQDDPVTFTVTAVTDPVGGSLTYQWQRDADANGTFANVTDGGVFSGATTVTLSISNTNTITENSQYRVLVMNTQADTVTSDAATLTYS
jgi:hypothetical protein